MWPLVETPAVFQSNTADTIPATITHNYVATHISATQPPSGIASDMALEALRGLIAQVPSWQSRLEDLNAQVHQRQCALASAESSSRPTTRSMTRNAYPNPENIIYYDGAVQGLFDELVRFVSTNRNMIRRAKMASRVAHIKRLAELGMKDEGGKAGSPAPQPRHLNTRRFENALKAQTSTDTMQSASPDVYEALDKNLELIQGASELAAFQYLKDATCTAEMNTLRESLKAVLDAAQAEVNRVELEEPELAQDSEDMTKARTRRPISVRRDIAPGSKGIATSTESIPSQAPDEPLLPGECAMEVDTSAIQNTTLDDIQLPPYRSTLYMRG